MGRQLTFGRWKAYVTYLTDLLTEYGRPIVSYHGTGVLGSDQQSADVAWAAAQFADGEVLLACEAGAAGMGVMWDGPTKFHGVTHDGSTVKAGRSIGEFPVLRELPEADEGSWAVYRLSMLHVDLAASGPPRLVRHLITNFEFDIASHEGITVNLPDGTGPVSIVPDNQDQFGLGRMRALRLTHPTAWVEMAPPHGQAVAARYIAERICGLLSLARGTKVSWIQEVIIGEGGVDTHRVHSAQVTKPFSVFAPIDHRFVPGIKGFLEATYSTYVERVQQFKLDRGTIDAVLDAKVEGDYLETRGAKLAVALETLKQNVLVANHPEVELYVTPEQFSSAVDDLAKAAKTALRQAGIPADLADSMCTPARFMGINRRSFSNLLRRMSRDIDLDLPPADVDLFVKCRNSLVHRGDYYCVSATDQERQEVPPKSSRFEEYLFLLSVVDAFLLRLVDYRGPYLVRTAGSEWTTRHV